MGFNQTFLESSTFLVLNCFLTLLLKFEQGLTRSVVVAGARLNKDRSRQACAGAQVWLLSAVMGLTQAYNFSVATAT